MSDVSYPRMIECKICGKYFDYNATDNVCICDECASDPTYGEAGYFDSSPTKAKENKNDSV